MLSVILLTTPFASVSAQEFSNSFENEIGSFFADQFEYETSRTTETIVKIHGQINDVSRASKVVIIFTLPDGSKTGNHVFTTDVGEFETLFPLNHESQTGQYSVFVSHDGKILGHIGFVVKEKPPESPFVKPTEEEIIEIPEDEGSYELEDGNLVYYLVTNGKLRNMSIDRNIITLSSDVNFFGDGAITLGIPRHILDAKENDYDIDFVVLVNGNQVVYSDVESNQYDRVIMIDSVAGLAQIKIIGTIQQETIPIEKQVLRVYVSDVPSWTTNMDDMITESLAYWENQYPNLDLEKVGKNELQDFFVLWVKEFGVEHVGYAFLDKFIEVGLGDSDCRGKWQPYSPDHVGYILKHEIGHILGLGHDPDPNSIMYPVAQNREYGLETEELVLTSGYAKYIPLCTIRDLTSYDISVTTDDPAYGFNVYVVDSEKQFQNFIDGRPIEHYKNNGCYKENTLNFVGSCNIGKGNGILLTINDKQTKSLTNIKIQLQEKSPNKTKSQTTIQTTKSPICGAGTIEKDGMCVPARIGIAQTGAKEGQWVKYTLDLNTDSSNEFVGLLLQSAVSQAFQSGDIKLDDVEWIKSEVVNVSQEQVTFQNSIRLKNEQTEAVSQMVQVQDLRSLSYINWVIPTNYEVGDVIYSDTTFGDAKITGIKTKTYGKKTFETIEVRTERTTNDEGNVMVYSFIQNYDKKTGVMLENLMEVKMADIILGTVSMEFRIQAIDSFTPNAETSGCLIATATFGSELAPQVQFLREIRDNTVLSTASGTSFMTAFNSFYYSFSPAVADLERQNPVFKEAVKLTITPLLSSLSLLQYVDIDTESEMLGYGIGIILLNIGIYFVAPAILILKLKPILRTKRD